MKKEIKKHNFTIAEYPRCKHNENKELVSESFETVHGQEYLQRVYADGAGELVRYDEEAGMWAVLSFPETVESGIEDKIRKVIRNNFDVGVCLNRQGNEAKAA